MKKPASLFSNRNSFAIPESRRTVLWVSVTAAMVFIVGGWAWSLQYSLAVPPAASSDDSFGTAAEDTAALFTNLQQQFEDLQERSRNPAAVQGLTSHDEAADETEPLSPEQVDLLKARVLEEASEQPQP